MYIKDYGVDHTVVTRLSKPTVSVTANWMTVTLVTCTIANWRKSSSILYLLVKLLVSLLNLFRQVSICLLHLLLCFIKIVEEFNEIFLFEQGNGGVIQFPKKFLKKAYQLVRMNGGVCIADEVFKCFCNIY
jgi:hypothetical protein